MVVVDFTGKYSSALHDCYPFLFFFSNSSGSWVAVFFFPASNGHPRDPDSLHYIDPSGRFNAYQQVGLSIYC